ncbi:MAG: hypothetical protein ACR2PS_18510 [Pseudomonadales bacterium]
MPKRLPKTPSKLIRLAIADFRRVLRLKKTYVVDMTEWHEPNSHCSVCLAGAVMAGTLKASPDVEMSPGDYDDATDRALYALNDFRMGCFWDALGTLGKDDLSDAKTEAIDDLEHTVGNKIHTSMRAKDWRTFNRHMLKLADELEKIRL